MIERRALRPNELDSWFDLLAELFTVPRDYFVRHWQNDPWQELEGIRVAVADGRLVASVRVFRRQLYLGGHQVSVGGIGEVCTHPEFRGQGLSGALLQDAIGFMEQSDLPLSLLFADLHGHYGRYGWQIVPISTAKVSLTSLRPAWGSPIQASPAQASPAQASPTQASPTQASPTQASPTQGGPSLTTPLQVTGPKAADLAELARIYASFAPQFQGGLVRSLDYWRSWWQAEQQVTRVGWRAGQPVGYLAARKLGNGDLLVQDFAVAEGEPVEPLFQQLATEVATALQAEPGAHISYPRIAYPGLHPVAVEEYKGAMLRINRPDLLPAEVAQLLEEAMAGQRHDWLWWPVDGF